jgi:hypothetical protein
MGVSTVAEPGSAKALKRANEIGRNVTPRVGEYDAIHPVCMYGEHLSQHDRRIRAQSEA